MAKKLKDKCKKTGRKKGPTAVFADSDYGPAADAAPDISLEEFEKKKLELLSSLPKTEEERNNIEVATRGQSSNNEWLSQRRRMITSSNFGLICKRRMTTGFGKLVENILYPVFVGKSHFEGPKKFNFKKK